MENQEEKQSNDIVEGKITTFASPAVLAAILDEESVNEDVTHGMVDVQEQEWDSERIEDSLESSLNDSLEFTKLQGSGDLERVDSNVSPSEPFAEQTDQNQVLDFPKSSTPVQNSNEPNSRKVERPPKPRRPQHIIERNKESVCRRMPVKTSYAQMHATKTRNKPIKIEEKTKKDREKSPGITPGPDSGLENQSEHLEESYNDLNQRTSFHGHASQAQHDVEYSIHDEQENNLTQDSYLNDALNTYNNHGPYYDVIQNSSLNYAAYQPGYSYQATSYTRGYQSAVPNLRQPHAVARPIPPLRYNQLSTQSAPPGGYHRTPPISNVQHLYEEDSYLSSILPNDSFQGSKIPESSLHRKFSSEPYLAQSSSPSLQKMSNFGSNSKATGSYSSLRQPFEYKPYTLKDYKNFAGVNAEHLAGGLGPNVDTDEFKEKVKGLTQHLQPLKLDLLEENCLHV